MLFMRLPDRTDDEVASAVDALLEVAALVAPQAGFGAGARRTSRKESVKGLDLGHEIVTFRAADEATGDSRAHLLWARFGGHTWVALSEHDEVRAFADLMKSPPGASRDAAIRETERRRPKGTVGFVLRGPRAPTSGPSGAAALAIGPGAPGMNADFVVDLGLIERFAAGGALRP
jgi:hypothetical protein